MTDYCDVSNFIGSYTGSSSSSLTTKNIDCVSLESNTVVCDALTIQGSSVSSDLTNLLDATQNQTATLSPAVTNFSGSLQASSLQANTLSVDSLVGLSSTTITSSSALVVNGVLTCTGLEVSNSTDVYGSTPLKFLVSSLANNSKASIVIGKNITPTDNAGTIYYNHLSTGNTANAIGMKLYNSSGYLEVQSSGTYISNKLFIDNTLTLPRRIGTWKTFTPTTTSYEWTDIGSSPGPKKIVISLMNMKMSNNANGATPFIQVGGTTAWYNNHASAYLGANEGNNQGSRIAWAASGIYLWNNVSIRNDSSTGTIYGVSGSIELTYAGTYTGTQEAWVVKGFVCAPAGIYACTISGVIYLTSSTNPILNSVRIIQNTSTFASGDANVMFY